ncbi:MAG: sulfatase-like hydrolase/transferase [Planctomycetaceae bacterium]|nr:sulfatase-like hydrolase/transferase [Planctomycetaceae bacterium]
MKLDQRFAIFLFILLAFPVMSTARPPNVLFILGDDQAWTDYGFMGHPDIKTPNLDKLAAGGVVFRRGYVPTALRLGQFPTGQPLQQCRPPHRPLQDILGCWAKENL